MARPYFQLPAIATKLDNKKSHNRILELSRPNHRLNRVCQKPKKAVIAAKKKYTNDGEAAQPLVARGCIAHIGLGWWR
ncbi:MAG TPA: hypothetical protein VNO32_39090 [Candidatus Acidoferrum sp.]|nr:hypothetical protein [Candidatus Acidoferrum sp.]